jgi:AraC-like DNA-binding protein
MKTFLAHTRILKRSFPLADIIQEISFNELDYFSQDVRIETGVAPSGGTITSWRPRATDTAQVLPFA